MNTNNSQAGQSPSESSIPNNEDQSNIDQLLSVEIVTTNTTTTTATTTTTTTIDQSSSSSIQFHPTEMILDVQEHNNLSTIQDARQTEQHYHHQQQQQQQQAFQQTQQQQRRQEEQQRLNQQQQRLQHELRQIQQQQNRLRQQAQCKRQRQQQEREHQRLLEWLEGQNLTYAQWIERQNQEREQRLQERYRRQAERHQQRQKQFEYRLYLERIEREHEYYLSRRSPGYDELIDEILQEREFEQYDLERLPPQQRQEILEQEYLNELQGYPTQQPHIMPISDLERYAKFQEEQLSNDEFEQTINIDQMEKWDKHVQHYCNEEQLIQKEQWEEIAFLHQQLQQPIH